MAYEGAPEDVLILSPGHGKTFEYEHPTPGKQYDVEASVKFFPQMGAVDKSRPASWIRMNTNLKPFYEPVVERTFTFAIKPPTSNDLLKAKQIKAHQVPKTLTQKLLEKEKKESSRNSLLLEEEWCIAKWKKESFINERCKPKDVRCEAILTPVGQQISCKTIWKKLSRSIKNDELADCNACFKKAEGNVFIFFFKSKKDLAWIKALELFLIAKAAFMRSRLLGLAELEQQ